jgi:hypothetical protein
MLIFVAWDGDHIGRQVGRASRNDDVEGLRRISQAIDQGNNIWRSWVESTGGSLISCGGDEGRAEVAADRIGELPAIREQYAGKVGSTVSVGVGMKLSEAEKALIAAKLKGEDQIVFFSNECDELIEKARRAGEKTEESKIADEYLGKSNGLLRAAAFRHKNTGKIVETGSCHDVDQCPSEPNNPEDTWPWEEGFTSHDGKFLNRKQAAEYVKMNKLRPAGNERNWLDSFDGEAGLNKAAPAMNPGAFAGAKRPSAPSVDKPIAAQPDTDEMDALKNVLGDDNAPAPPERTSAAADFERQLHDEAWKGEEEDMPGTSQKPSAWNRSRLRSFRPSRR